MSEDLAIEHPIMVERCICGDPDCEWAAAWDYAVAQLARAYDHAFDYTILMGGKP